MCEVFPIGNSLIFSPCSENWTLTMESGAVDLNKLD